MSEENRLLFNARILTFLNRYLKHGTIVKSTDPFYARGEIESLIKEAYIQGRLDAEGGMEITENNP